MPGLAGHARTDSAVRWRRGSSSNLPALSPIWEVEAPAWRRRAALSRRRLRRPLVVLLAVVACASTLLVGLAHSPAWTALDRLALRPRAVRRPRRIIGRPLEPREAVFPTLQQTQYNETAEDPYAEVDDEDTVWNAVRTLELPDAIADDPLLNTRPVRRPPPEIDDGITKYLSYRPHGVRDALADPSNRAGLSQSAACSTERHRACPPHQSHAARSVGEARAAVAPYPECRAAR